MKVEVREEEGKEGTKEGGRTRVLLFVIIFLKLSEMWHHFSSRDLETGASRGYLDDPGNIGAAFFPAPSMRGGKRNRGWAVHFFPFPSLTSGLMNSGRLRVGGFKSGAEGLIFISSANK